MISSRLSGNDLAQLLVHGFDPVAFDGILSRWTTGALDRDLVVMAGRLSAPLDADLSGIPEDGSEERARLEEAGRVAIDAGRVGAIVLNGGMATRFGGIVKGTVEVASGRSFIDLKISQVRAVGDRTPIFLMDSPATHAATLEHLSRLPVARHGVQTFLQPVAPRIMPSGELAREVDGRVSTAGMGHGDLLAAFARQRLDGFERAGGSMLFVSNVDNLGACLDPAIVGSHLAGGARVSVEVAPRKPADRGGMPVRLDGRPVLLEGFRIPPEFDLRDYSTFNTNTFCIDASVFGDAPDLEAWPVRKEVAGRTVIQFERILGEVTHIVDSRFIAVPASGPLTRFIPIKHHEDLDLQRPAIVECMGRWGVT